jgi:hypothetical protein
MGPRSRGGSIDYTWIVVLPMVGKYQLAPTGTNRQIHFEHIAFANF